MPYSSMEQVNASIKGIDPPVTLAQANAIARQADSITGVDNPWAVAISSFKKAHKVEGGKWVRKGTSTYGGGDGSGKGQGSGLGRRPERKEMTLAGRILADVADFFSTNENMPEWQDWPELTEKDFELVHGIKTFDLPEGKYVALWTSNAFEDRDKEIITTKAWENYVGRADHTKERGRVWFWHVKGTDFADVIWQGVEGRMLLEIAKVDNTDYGNKMFHALQHPEQFPEVVPYGWGTSHGFVYRASDKAAGEYAFVHKFESTVLPWHRASNLYGGLVQLWDNENKEVTVMGSQVSQEKADGLAALVGPETAAMLLDMAKQASEDLELAGINTKADKKAPPPPPPPAKAGDEEEEEEEEMETEEEKEFYELELTPELMGEIAAQVDVKSAVEESLRETMPAILKEFSEVLLSGVKEAMVGADLASKEQIVQEALSGTLRLVPHTASQARDNLLSGPEVKELYDKEEKARAASQDPVKNIVNRMLTGQIQ